MKRIVDTTNNRRTAKEESSAQRTVETVIANHPFLSGLDPKHLRVLAENSLRMRYEPGDLIFREGDPANRFYLIEEGQVAFVESRSKRI